MRSSRRSFLLNPLSMLLAGLLLGIAARLFDIYFQNLGEIFSQMAIWILLGTGFAIYSPTKKAAIGNIFPFCMGMLAAYYVTAAITHGVYSRTFIIGWTLFALPSPVMAYFAWMAKEPGAFSKIIAAGIAAVSVIASVDEIDFDQMSLSSNDEYPELLISDLHSVLQKNQAITEKKGLERMKPEELYPYIEKNQPNICQISVLQNGQEP